MLDLAARTHNRAAVFLHATHFAAFWEFWTDWLPWHGNSVLTVKRLGSPGDGTCGGRGRTRTGRGATRGTGWQRRGGGESGSPQYGMINRRDCAA